MAKNRRCQREAERGGQEREGEEEEEEKEEEAFFMGSLER